MRFPAADLLPGDLVNWPSLDGAERIVQVKALLRPEDGARGRGRVLRFTVEHDGHEGLMSVGDRASVDVRFTTD